MLISRDSANCFREPLIKPQIEEYTIAFEQPFADFRTVGNARDNWRAIESTTGVVTFRRTWRDGSPPRAGGNVKVGGEAEFNLAVTLLLGIDTS